MYLEFQLLPDWWTGAYRDDSNQLLVTEWGESKEDVLTLFAGEEGYFRLFGETTASPEEMWGKADAAFRVTLVFSFVDVSDLYALEEEPEEAASDLEEAAPEEPELEEPAPEEPAPEEPTPEEPDPEEPAPEEPPELPDMEFPGGIYDR